MSSANRDAYAPGKSQVSTSSNMSANATTSERKSMKDHALAIYRQFPGPLLGLIVVVLVLSFLSPYFLTIRNIVNIFSQVSDIGIMAIGAALVIFTGGDRPFGRSCPCGQPDEQRLALQRTRCAVSAR